MMYYCRKYIKLSETKEFDKAHKKLVKGALARLSSVCRVCGKKGEEYKFCSKCMCVCYTAVLVVKGKTGRNMDTRRSARN